MRLPFFHPRWRTLNAFADGTLEDDRRRRVADHLADCSRCRNEVRRIREIADAAPELARTRPPEGALEEVLLRRSEGERVVLPTSDPERRKRSWTSLAAAAAVVLLAGAAVLFSLTSEAEADRSVLRFDPVHPTAGATVDVEYEPTTGLEDEEVLRLRGRLRTPTDEQYARGMDHVEVTTLRRSDDGAFRGTFTLPDSVVYAAFAVEDTAATIVDHNERKLWELLVQDDRARPLAEALEQRANDLMGRNWELAYESARRLAELYPDRVESWSFLFFYERAVLGERARDSLLAVHRPRLVEFDRRYRNREDLPGERLGRMMWYAGRVGDSAVERRWRERLLEEAPVSPLAIQERVLYEIDRARDHPEGAAAELADLEALWEEATAQRRPEDVGRRQDAHLVREGFAAALATGDSAVVMRWAERRVNSRPEDRRYVGAALADVPDLRDEGIGLLKEELAQVEAMPDEDRLLRRIREEHRRSRRDRLRRVLADLGDALLAEGDTTDALRHYERAASAGWDPDLFREAAEVFLSAGDTVQAGRLLARAAVDPRLGGSSRHTAKSLLGPAFDPEEWSRWKAEGENAMHRAVMEEVTLRRTADRIRLLKSDGARASLEEAVGGGPALVVFWSRFCGPALHALPEIQRTADRLDDRGVPTVLITDEAPSTELTGVLDEEGVTVPIYHDTRREAAQAFNQWGTPSYFVLDQRGRIRFEYSDLTEVPRQVAVLLDR